MAVKRILDGGTHEVWVEDKQVTGFVAVRTGIPVIGHDPAELSRVSATVYIDSRNIGKSPTITKPVFVLKEPEGVVEVQFTVTDMTLTFTLDIWYNGWQKIDPAYGGFGQVMTPGLCNTI